MNKDEKNLALAKDFVENALTTLGPQARRVAEYFLQNPKASQKEIAARFEITPQRVSNILRSNRFLKALKDSTRMNAELDTPLAYQSFRECLQSQKSDEVKFRASVRLLEENQIFGPEKRELLVNDITKLSTEDLVRIIEKNKNIGPTSFIEGELVEPDNTPTEQ